MSKSLIAHFNPGYPVLFAGVYGSHLYGLNRPESDLDYKGVCIPSFAKTILGTYDDVVEIKSLAGIDLSYFSIQKFIRLLEKGDTVSIDMLHTPEEFTIITSPLWEQLRSLRHLTYCKNMRGILGYIKTHASKYGHKVQRFNELSSFVELLQTLLKQYDQTVMLSDVLELSQPNIKLFGYKYIQFNPRDKDVQENIEVLGKRYTTNASLGYLKSQLDTTLSGYGERVKKSDISGGDWKAISHAYRVLLQLEEIVDTRDLKFPLKSAPEIFKIKSGQMSEFDSIKLIDEGYDRVISKLDASDLPEHADLTPMKEVLITYCSSLVEWYKPNANNKQ